MNSELLMISLIYFRHGDFKKNATCGYDHEHNEEKQDFLKNLEDNKLPHIANHLDGLEFNRILRVRLEITPCNNLKIVNYYLNSFLFSTNVRMMTAI